MSSPELLFLDKLVSEGYVMTTLIAYLILQNMEQTRWVKQVRNAIVNKNSIDEIGEEDLRIETSLPRLSSLFEKRDLAET